MSRYPAMGQAPQQPEMSNAAYDQSLLAYAPQVTKADKQQGYDIDILERQPVGPNGRVRINLDSANNSGYFNTTNNSSATLGLPPPLPTLENTPSYNVNHTSYSPPALQSPYTPYGKKVPWWRTKKGMICLGIGCIVILGIIVGVIAGVVSAQKSSKTANVNNALSSPLENGESLSSTPISLAEPTSTPTTPQLSTVRGSQPVPVTQVPLPIATSVGSGSQVEQPEVVVQPVSPQPVRPINGNTNGSVNNPATSTTTRKPLICATFPTSPACL